MYHPQHPEYHRPLGMLNLVGNEEERLLSYLYQLDEPAGDATGAGNGLEIADYTFTTELGD